MDERPVFFTLYSLMTMHLPVLFLLFVTGAARAQSSSDAWWTIGTASHSASSANEAIIRQAGAGNQATLAMLAGSANRLDVSQTANGNAATVQVTGRANGLQLSQNGSGNVFDLGLQGNNNSLKVSQEGGDVARLSSLTSNTKLELIQRSGSNVLITDGPLSTGTGAANLRIEQTGGATVRIQTGHSF